MALARRPSPDHDDQLQSLFDTLLYSVSHDLRSPLLTISLSAELLTEQLQDSIAAETADGGTSGAAIAIDAMRHGAGDLERMLQALTMLSRARRRVLDEGGARLQMLLGGHIVLSEEPDLEMRLVAADPLVVRELLDALAGDTPAEVYVAIEGAYVVLRVPAPAPTPAEGSALEALVGSLQRYAGTVVESLAVAELLLGRQGGALTLAAGEAVLWLPLAGRRAPA